MSKANRTTQRRRALRAARALLLLAGVVAGASVLLPGTGSASSSAMPANTAEPVVQGTPVVDNTLTATTGTWSGSTPMTFTYQWRRCPKTGGASDASDCTVVSDATRSTYRVRQEDVGFTLRVRVTATNADGSATVASNATAVVKAAATKPANTSPPTISGQAAVGQALTVNGGTWSGTQPISLAYQWRRCDQNGGSCADIDGATGRTYTLKTVDAGNTLRVRVTARNSAGTTTATSAPTAVVTTAPSPPATGCPAGTGPVEVTQVESPARLLVDGMQMSPSVVTGSTRQIVVRFHVSACGRPVHGALVYATTVPFNQFSIPPEQQTGSDGWASLQLTRLGGFPAAQHQQLLVMFARARKAGENFLGGISTRRLVSLPVDLNS
jgi:hypothetical protein